MSSDNYDIRIDADGTIERLRLQLGAMPADIARAQRRALSKLATWIQRKVLRELSAVTGATQKTLKAIARYQVARRDDSLSIWLGTSPLKVHHLGTVKWTRRMRGARVGRRSYPGTWSWPTGPTTGLVMERLSDARLDIAPVTVEIHAAVRNRIQALQPEIDARYLTVMAHELNYVLNVEQARA